MKTFISVWMLTCGWVLASDFSVGMARVKITPPTPYWLSGYAARTNPAPTVLQDLWAKALSLRDTNGNRVVMVTADLIGIPSEISVEVFSQARRQFNIDSSQLVLNFSHTHSGPVVGSNLSVMFDFNKQESNQVHQYGRELTANLVRVIGESLRNMAPAKVWIGKGAAHFATNRRAPTSSGFKIGVNPEGPMDTTVPVVKVTSLDGTLRAVLFGYGCHNTTLGGNFYQINGDYAGHAQAAFEKSHPQTLALFMMLCGGDQNPNPRGAVEQAQEYGNSLAKEVDRVLQGEMKPVSPFIRTAGEFIKLDFAEHTRETFEEELKTANKFQRRRAQLMIDAYDRHKPVRQIEYPIQAIRLGAEVTFVTLGGEVVVDYSLRVKKEYPSENLVISGYCNDVMCYIPSLRVLREGGYEPVESMIYYGLPGPFSDTVEEKVFASIHRMLKNVGVSAEAQKN